MAGSLLLLYQTPPGFVANTWATELSPRVLPQLVSRPFSCGRHPLECLPVQHLVPEGWVSLVPYPGSMFVLDRFSTEISKPCWIIRPGEVFSAGHMLLLEGKKPGGESMHFGISISHQEGLPVSVFHVLPHGWPVCPVPVPDSTSDGIFSRRQQLNLR